MKSSEVVLSSISKSYESTDGLNTDKILNNINTTLPLKGLTAIIGWSGSGKSTLLNILSLADNPDMTNGLDGSTEPSIDNSKLKYFINGKHYEIDYSSGKPVATIDSGKTQAIELDDIRQELFGTIFQQHYLHPNLTVKSNLQVPFLTSGKALSSEDIVKFAKLLEIDHKLDKYVDELSGGEAQRVALLRGYLKQPPILFADEPTNNLDNIRKDSFLQVIKQSLQDSGSSMQTCFWVSHDLDLVAKLADNVILVKDGYIEVFSMSANRFSPNELLEMFGSKDKHGLLDQLDSGDSAKTQALSTYPKPASNVKFIDHLGFYLEYTKNEFFKHSKPTNEFIFGFFSVFLITLFSLSLLGIGNGLESFLQDKISDPRLNFIEISSATPNELKIENFDLLKEKLSNKIRYITPVYQVSISSRENIKRKSRNNSGIQNRSRGVAYTFRPNDPVVKQILGSKIPEFATSKKKYAGLILTQTEYKKHYESSSVNNGLVEITFNTFNTGKKNKSIPVQVVNGALPGVRTRYMLREDFYISNYKSEEDEAKPFIHHILVYPHKLSDAEKLKEEIQSIKDEETGVHLFKVFGQFKLMNKVKVFKELMTRFETILLIFLLTITLLAVVMITLGVHRSLISKQSEIGVLRNFGLSRKKIVFLSILQAGFLWVICSAFALPIYVYVIQPIITKIISNDKSFTTLISSQKVLESSSNSSLPLYWYMLVFGATLTLCLISYGAISWYISKKLPAQLVRS